LDMCIHAHGSLLIHTDDCDAAGEDEQILKDIFSKLNSIWSIKHVDAEYMLGITRKITYTQDDQKCIESIECTMTAFIQSIHDSFKQHMINAAVNTPFPEKLRLSKDTAPDETESAKVIAQGYQRAVGMLLWAARHCYPECKYGVSQLCSVMSKPAAKQTQGHPVQTKRKPHTYRTQRCEQQT